jgi:hypothetical protein
MRSQMSFAHAFFELASRLPFQPPEAFVTELVRLANLQPDMSLFVGKFHLDSVASWFFDSIPARHEGATFAILDSEGFVEEPWPQQVLADLRTIAEGWSLLPIEDTVP